MTIDLDLDELESEVRENITEPWSLDPEAILELIALARKGQAYDSWESEARMYAQNAEHWRKRAEAYERAIRLALKESGDSIVRTIWAAKLEKALEKWSK